MEKSEKNFAILREMYNELRNYRDKEFKTFTFTFPIIGLGLIPKIETPYFIAIISLTTLFGVVMLRYLYKNHSRMLKIKKVIFEIQQEEDINDSLTTLTPKEWVNKSTENHLGTMTYILVLIIEMTLTWCFYIWRFLH